MANGEQSGCEQIIERRINLAERRRPDNIGGQSPVLVEQAARPRMRLELELSRGINRTFINSVCFS